MLSSAGVKHLAVIMVASGMALAAAPRSAHATELSIETLDHGTWGDAVATLQRSLSSGGSTVQVVVVDEGGRPARCGEYVLTPDAVTAAAFTLGSCDPVTGATLLTLTHRDGLFAPDVPVWRPLAAGLVAVQVRHAAAQGGATNDAYGEVRCSASVRPYVVDLHDGRRVYLTPDRYALRVLDASAHVDADPTGWTVRANVSAALDMDYEVTDRRDGRVVLHERVDLGCARASAEAPASPQTHATYATRATPDPPASTPEGAWARSATGHRGETGARYATVCPAGTPRPVWGSQEYTDDSSICTAAVHAGLIRPDGGGVVTYAIGPGREQFAGSTRNGITALSYGSFPGSFTFPDASTTTAATGAVGDASEALQRPFAQYHFDIFMLHANQVDLSAAVVHTAAGQRLGSAIGLDHVSTFGVTPFIAPHVGFGVEIPYAAFSIHGGYLPWGIGGDHWAAVGFFQVTAALRAATGPVVLSAGPSVGGWFLQGSAGGGWSTGLHPEFGAEAEARIRMECGQGRHNGPATMAMDIFVRFTATFIDDPAWMISIGEGWGSLPGRST